MSEPRLPGKSQDIPKRLIWDAWLKVKENGGAAGADGVTIEQFETTARVKIFEAGLSGSSSRLPGVT